MYICLIVVDLEYVATSMCSLLSNTRFFAYRGFFASFPVHLGVQKTPISTVVIIYFFKYSRTRLVRTPSGMKN